MRDLPLTLGANFSVFFKCLPSNNIRVSNVLLSGTVANQFAGQAAGGGVKLEKWHVHSQLTSINCYTNYHYSIMVNSIFPHLRAVLLYRLCLIIRHLASKLPSSAPAVALLPVSDIYKCLLVLLPGYCFASFEAVSKTFAYNPVGDPGSAVSFSLLHQSVCTCKWHWVLRRRESAQRHLGCVGLCLLGDVALIVQSLQLRARVGMSDPSPGVPLCGFLPGKTPILA